MKIEINSLPFVTSRWQRVFPIALFSGFFFFHIEFFHFFDSLPHEPTLIRNNHTIDVTQLGNIISLRRESVDPIHRVIKDTNPPNLLTQLWQNCNVTSKLCILVQPKRRNTSSCFVILAGIKKTRVSENDQSSNTGKKTRKRGEDRQDSVNET